MDNGQNKKRETGERETKNETHERNCRLCCARHYVFKPHDEHGNVVGGMVCERVLQEFGTRCLCIVNFTYEVDGYLVTDHVP
jgi:hypothetical protein